MLLDSACECREKHTLEIKQQHKFQPTFRMGLIMIHPNTTSAHSTSVLPD